MSNNDDIIEKTALDLCNWIIDHIKDRKHIDKLTEFRAVPKDEINSIDLENGGWKKIVFNAATKDLFDKFRCGYYSRKKRQGYLITLLRYILKVGGNKYEVPLLSIKDKSVAFYSVMQK